MAHPEQYARRLCLLAAAWLLAAVALGQDAKPWDPAIADGPPDWPPPCTGTPADPCTGGCSLGGNCILQPPRMAWYTVVDAVALIRIPEHAVDLASLNGPTNVVLTTGDLQGDLRAGGRALIGHTCNECFQIEGVFMGVAQAAHSAAIRNVAPNDEGGLGNLFSPFGGFGTDPILGVDYNNLVDVRYEYSLQSVELNIRRKVPVVPDRLTTSILFGARYLALPERFWYSTLSDVPAPAGSVNLIQVETQNQMVGPQIGALFELYVDNRWWINTEIKAALLNNQARQQTSYHNVDGDGMATDFFGEARGSHTAWAGEINVMFIYRWSPNLSTRLGYQALLVSDVASAPANLGTDLNLVRFGPAQLNRATDVAFHGPQAGVSLAW